MNLIVCDENCRWQKEGYCTLDDLTRISGGKESLCRHYEKELITKS